MSLSSLVENSFTKLDNFSDSLSVYNSWKLVETLENVEDSQLCPVFDPFHERFDMRMKRNRILAENKHVLRAFAVVEWLQGMAFEEHVKNPKVALKNLEMEMTRTRQAAGQGNIVEYLDPDARSRTGKKISQSDLEDESEFYTAVFSLFRQGRMDDAILLCDQSNTGWRLASIMGHVPMSLPLNWKVQSTITQVLCDEGEEVTLHGTPNDLLWKNMCALLSSNSSNPKEALVYSYLAGNLNWNGVCWEDIIWSKLVTHTRNSLDSLVQEQMGESMEGMFESIPLKDLLPPSSNFYQNIQRLLILADYKELLLMCSTAIQDVSISGTDKEERLLFSLQMACYIQDRYSEIVGSLGSEAVSMCVDAIVNWCFQSKKFTKVSEFMQFLPETDQIDRFADFLLKLGIEDRFTICLSAKSSFSEEVIARICLTLFQRLLPAHDIPAVSVLTQHSLSDSVKDLSFSVSTGKSDSLKSVNLECISLLEVMLSLNLFDVSIDGALMSHYIVLNCNTLFRHFLKNKNEKFAKVLIESLEKFPTWLQNNLFSSNSFNDIDVKEQLCEMELWFDYVRFFSSKLDNSDRSLLNVYVNLGLKVLTRPGYWSNYLNPTSFFEVTRISNYFKNISTDFWLFRKNELSQLRKLLVPFIFESVESNLARCSYFSESMQFFNVILDFHFEDAFSSTALKSLLQKWSLGYVRAGFIDNSVAF